MIDKVLTMIFGSKHERDVKAMRPIVAQINALEAEVSRLSDEELRAKTDEFRARLRPAVQALEDVKKEVPREENAITAAKADLQSALDDLLPEAFAVAREAGKRVLNMRHFDVQLMGGIVLHRGKIAEMKTGEGKTLVATLPVYLNALTGRGVHVVTVNDYLARRDAEWMGRLYKFLGLTVGVIQNPHGDRERQQAYSLRRHLRHEQRVRLRLPARQHEVRSRSDGAARPRLRDRRRGRLHPHRRSPDAAHHQRTVGRIDGQVLHRGAHRAEADRGEGFPGRREAAHGCPHRRRRAARRETSRRDRALRSRRTWTCSTRSIRPCARATLYKRDVEYVVKDGEVLIVDEFTGRLMPGRRWSDGLHQAVEAKENVKIESENQTLATITFQNLFRMYDKLAGMTGTADTEAAEFDKIYKLEVVVIPPNRIMVRSDLPDLVYRTEREKFDAIVDEIKQMQATGQPSLVGTISIEKSEQLAAALKKQGIPHVVLNAKYHEREAEIVAQAGHKGAVTIATNMAGRGTDILLGGNPEYLAAQKNKEVEDPKERTKIEEQIRETWEDEHKEVVRLGGLHILGTERHESRRIDNQLRGRAGRQGDPGSSRFYLSLEDDLMRIFGGDRIMGLMERLGMEEGVPIEHGMVTRAIERAQKQVEGRNFEARKHLLEYDDVMNKQRESIYTLRRSILDGREGKEYIVNAADEIVEYLVDRHYPEDQREHPNEVELNVELYDYFGLDLKAAGADLDADRRDEVKYKIVEAVHARYEEKERLIGADNMRLNEKYLLLQVIDQQWKDHLLNIDHLKEGIGLRGYGQRDPLVEYKRESFELFQEMMERIQDRVVKVLWKIELAGREGDHEESQRVQRALPPQPPKQQLTFSGAPKEAPAPVKRAQAKVGRNDPCPCGSGKKYKKCHGTAA